MTVIEIQAIRPPREPRKPGHVIDADGASFEAWPEKLAKLQVGQRYAVEIEEREWQGRPIRKITKAQPFGGRGLETRMSQNPASHDAGKWDKRPAAPVSRQVGAKPDAEPAFVATIVSAFIAAGKVGLDRGDLEQAVTLARALWRTTMGGADAR
jgi:hypothetical protein